EAIDRSKTGTGEMEAWYVLRLPMKFKFSSEEADLLRLHQWLRRVVVPLASQTRLGPRGISVGGSGWESSYRHPSELGAPLLRTFLRDATGHDQHWRVMLDELGHVTVAEENRVSAIGLEAILWEYVRPGAFFPFAKCSICDRIFVPTSSKQVYHSR